MSDPSADSCIRSQSTASPLEGDLAIAHTLFNEYPGTHCGVFFHTREKETRLLHLALHLCLLEESTTSKSYAIVSSDLVRTQRRQLSKLCRLIIEKHGNNVPYGFRFGVVINSDGSFPALKPGDGFTCTTFVLAIYANVNFYPVDIATWPMGANAEWQDRIMDAIRSVAQKRGWDVEDHLAALKGQGNAIRVTPQEIAAALCLGQNRYDELAAFAAEIAEYLRNNFPVLGSETGGAAA